jgi:hypothetical protein
MSDEQKNETPHKRHGILMLIPWIMLGGLVLYVLSIGPALGYDWFRGESFETIYAPIIWLAENTPLEKPIGWYVDLWWDF